MTSTPPQGGNAPRRGLPLAPLLLFVIVWLGGSWLVLGAWLAPVVAGGWMTIAAGFGLGAIPVATLIRGLRCTVYPSAAVRRFILRPFWYAVLFFPLLAALTLLSGLFGWVFGAHGAAGIWGRGALAGGAVVAVVIAVVGYAGSRRLVIRRLEVTMPSLPAAFEGLRIVQLSDLHVGPQTGRRFLAKIAEAVRREQPDLLVFTGDQVDDFARDVELFVAAFGALRAPEGVFAIAGNHDLYADWQAVRQGLEGAGITVLVNESMAIERAGERLWIAGTGDPAGRSWPGGGARGTAPDLEATLRGIPPKEPVLALAHNPILWPALAALGVDLTLSGHTHYGQIAIPRWNWCLASPFLELALGAHRQGRSLLYIHPGTNHWGLPLRLGTPPEVAVLTLRGGGAATIGG